VQWCFFSVHERVHVAKAGAQAERDALRGAASRAEAILTRAQADLAKARAEAKVRSCLQDQARTAAQVGVVAPRNCSQQRAGR
jgi:hypothetical protein